MRLADQYAPEASFMERLGLEALRRRRRCAAAVRRTRGARCGPFPLLAVPVFAVWKAIIVHWIMRAVRVRAAGPVVIAELDALLAERTASLGELARHLMLSAVEEAILRARDAHPSYVLLLASLFDRLEVRARRAPPGQG